jgi:DNA primase
MVEGYTDVISLHQAGIENAVASSGTALTPDQIRLIKRITPNITMLYDGDAAGIKAALRGTDLILEEGMNVRVVVLPDSEDPDSFVKKTGAEGFSKFLRENRKDLILFKTSLLAEEAKKDPIKKAALIRDILESIGKIPDAIQRSVYVKECSQMFDMNEQIIITEVNKLRRKKIKEQQEGSDKEAARQEVQQEELPQSLHQEQLQQQADSLPVLERDVVRILLEFGTWEVPVDDTSIRVAAYVLDELEGIDLETEKYKAIFSIFRQELNEGQIPDDKFFTRHADSAIASTSIEILTQPYSVSDNWWSKYKIVVPEKQHTFIKDIQSAILRLKQYRNIGELKKVEKLIKETKDDAELMKLMKLHKLLIEQKKEFARTVGNVVYRPIN